MSDQSQTTHRLVWMEPVSPSRMRSLAAQQAHSNALFRPTLTMGQDSIAEVHSWTYACLRARMNAYAAIPMRVYSGSRSSRTEAQESHPLSKLFDRPNKRMGYGLFAKHHRRMLDIDGAALIILDPFIDETSKRPLPFIAGTVPTEMWPQLATDYQAAVKDQSGTVTLYTVEQLRKSGCDLSTVVYWQHVRFGFRFPPEQIIYATMIEGAPLKAARIPAEADFLSGKFSREFISNDCMPSGWFTHERVLTDEEYKLHKDRNKSEHEGADNAGKTMLLEGGMTFTPNPSTHRDMQWVEGKQHWRDEECAVFGVPKSILSIGDEAKYANHLSTIRVFTEQTIFPLLTDFEDLMWSQLLSNVESGRYWIEHDTAGIPSMQSDQIERMTMAQQAVFMGVPLADAITAFALPFDIKSIEDSEAAQDQIPDSELDLAAPAAAAPQPINVTALQAIVQSVADGILPAEAAISMIPIGFPSITTDQAKAMVIPASDMADDNEQAPDSEGVKNMPAPDEAQQDATDEEGATNNGDGQQDDNAEEDRTISGGDRGLTGARATARSRLSTAIAKRKRAIASRAKANAQWQEFRASKVHPTERKFERRMVREFNGQRKEILAQFDAMAGRKSADLNERASRLFTMEDIAAIKLNESRWNARFGDVFTDLYRTMVNATGQDLSSMSDVLVFNAVNPKWVKLINDRVGSKLVGVNKDTTDAVRAALRRGLLEGETGKELRERLRTLPEFSRARARTVAVTEMGYTVNETRREQFEGAGFDQVVWVTSGTDRVRDSHVQAERDGPRRRGEPFSNGLRWPYDETGPAEEVINCECGLSVPLD